MSRWKNTTTTKTLHKYLRRLLKRVYFVHFSELLWVFNNQLNLNCTVFGSIEGTWGEPLMFITKQNMWKGYFLWKGYSFINRHHANHHTLRGHRTTVLLYVWIYQIMSITVLKTFLTFSVHQAGKWVEPLTMGHSSFTLRHSSYAVIGLVCTEMEQLAIHTLNVCSNL